MTRAAAMSTTTAIPEPPRLRRIIKMETFAEALGCTTQTIYLHMKRIPGFPQSVRVGLHRVGFYEDEVVAYISSLPRATERPTIDVGKRKSMKKKKAA